MLATGRAAARSIAAPVAAAVSQGRTRVAGALAPVVTPPMRLLRWCARIAGTVADALWRIPLIVAAVAMAAAGIVHARGNQDLAWTLVTGGFAIGLLGVPLGLISVGFGRQEPTEPQPGGEPTNRALDAHEQESHTVHHSGSARVLPPQGAPA